MSLPTDVEEDAPPLRAQLMLAEEFRPIPSRGGIVQRARCEEQRCHRCTQGVDNGKSDDFLRRRVGVQPQDAASYSIIIKQLNAQDVSCSFAVPQLVPRHLQAEAACQP